MGRPRKVRPNWNELATIWTVSDELWAVIAPLLADVDPPKPTGRPRVDARRTLDALIFADAQRLPVEPVTGALSR
jgi:hypothetical protein